MRCPHCYQPVNWLATKCPHCTGDIDPAENAKAEVGGGILSIVIVLVLLGLLTKCVS